MWATLLIAVVSVVPDLISAVLEGLFAFDLGHFAASLGKTAVFMFAVYAIYAKNWKISVPAMILAWFVSPLVGLIMLTVLVVNYLWSKLEQEEGYPIFDITYAEQQERQRKMEMISQHRALELGARAEHAGNPDDMTDVLDPAGNTPVSRAGVSGYAQRPAFSTPGTEAVPEFSRGIMDDLTDIGTQPQGVRLDKDPAPADPSAPRVNLSKEPFPAYPPAPDYTGQNNQPH